MKPNVSVAVKKNVVLLVALVIVVVVVGLWTESRVRFWCWYFHVAPEVKPRYPSVNTHRLFGRVLGVNPTDADPKCKWSLRIREVVLKSEMHILDLQLEEGDTRVQLENRGGEQVDSKKTLLAARG